MTDIQFPAYNGDGDIEIIRVSLDDLSFDESLTAHMYLDAVEYALEGSQGASHLGERGGEIQELLSFDGATVLGYVVVTDINELEELANEGEINPSEDHSL